MAKAATKAAWTTTLAIGEVEIGVGLFTAHADPKKKLVVFDTAGPNGGVLKARAAAQPVPVEEAGEVDRPDTPVHSDPLAGELSPPAQAAHDHLTASGWDEQTAGEVAERVGAPMGKTEIAGAEGLVDGEYGRQLVEEGTGEVVSPEEIRRGVRREDGSFVDCTEQLAQIEERTRLEKMDVVSFIDSTAVGRGRVVKSYWLGAMDEKAPTALRLIFEGLKATRRVALVKLTKRSRQSLGVIGWEGKALKLFELVWAEDLREPPARATVIQKAAVTEAMVENMKQLIAAKSDSPAAIDELRDDAIELREELYTKAERGEIEAIAADLAAKEEDDGLMAQLEASLAAVA